MSSAVDNLALSPARPAAEVMKGRVEGEKSAALLLDRYFHLWPGDTAKEGGKDVKARVLLLRESFLLVDDD